MLRVRFGLAVFAVSIAFTASPAKAADLALICRLRQTGDGSVTEFLRRLDIDQQAKTVRIADDLGRGFQLLPQDGMLMRLDRSRIVFDYVDAVSIGHSVIRSHSGAYRLRDGKFITRGFCASVLPDSGAAPTTSAWPVSPHRH